MFEIKVSGITEAAIWIKNDWPTKIVSLLNPEVVLDYDVEAIVNCGIPHLLVKVHDIEEPMEDQVLPNKNHIGSVFDFTKDLKENDRILVHCHMGVSRSAATAIGILMQHGMDYESAYTYIKKIRDCASPNHMIVKLLDDWFRLNGEFTEYMVNIRKQEFHTRYSSNVSGSDVDVMKGILEMVKMFEDTKK
jgi:predicted protein tyrosine phosphatase